MLKKNSNTHSAMKKKHDKKITKQVSFYLSNYATVGFPDKKCRKDHEIYHQPGFIWVKNIGTATYSKALREKTTWF